MPRSATTARRRSTDRSSPPAPGSAGARTPFTASIALLALPLAALVAAPLLAPAGADATAQERRPRPPEMRRAAPALSAELLDGLTFRSIGPAVTGGRIHDVEALPDDPATVYVATASGGLWKTTNQGTTWRPIFDDQPVSTFGDVAIAPSDPDVVWAGTGEQQNRQSTSWGNGVYRSTDGGETWRHLGLEETRHIGRVRVHPRDPDVAYVAALGNLWKPSEARGVYRTRDGGRSWQKVLYVDSLTGVVDLAMDPGSPDVLYAAAYQRLRRSWGFNGGGPGSGIYKTTDGGETWRELTEGLPEGDKGRIGLALAESDPSILYALVEHGEDEGEGTYRSDDAGETWRKVNDMNPRPMYYSHIFADPRDPDRVYVLATEFYMSEDGGATFREMPTRPTYDVGVHSDHHTLWIDPEDTEHFYLAGDAGLHESFDRGETYRRINNVPIGQFYAIGLDDRRPFHVWGGMQDNHSWEGPSATRRWIGIINDDWNQVGFGDGMYQQPAGGSHRAVFVGAQNGEVARTDGETGDRLDVHPVPPAGEEDYRFDWVTPSLASRHDSNTVYLGGNRLFITRDRGSSWERTPDLTKAIDRDTLPLMGVPGSEPMLSKHDGTASYSEIVTISESPTDGDVLWVGTDDGNVQVSRDGGATWTEVGGSLRSARDGLHPTTYVSRVTASASGPGTAYVALDAHRRGDFAPYLFRTEDFGRSWTDLSAGIPVEAGSVSDVIEHPEDPSLLFLGTEHHLYVSKDGAESWTRFGSNLPTTLYDDLAIHPRDGALVLGTHGRSLWILDDLTPLVEWTGAAAREPAHLFSVKPATFFHYWKSTSYRSQAAFSGDNPPFGAILHYHLAQPADSSRIVVRDGEGTVVRRLAGPGEAGVIHRVVWDLRHEPPASDDEDDEEEAEEEAGVGRVVESDTVLPELRHPVEPAGPFVSPGTYTVTLEAGDATAERTVEVRGDPRLDLTQRQHEEREAFLLDLAALLRRASEAAGIAGDSLDALTARRDSLHAAGEDLPELEERIGAAEERSRRLRGLRRDLSRLASAFNRSGVTQGSLHPPTRTHRDLRERLERELEEALGTSGGAEAEEPGRGASGGEDGR